MSNSILEIFEFKPRKDYRDECYQKLKADLPLLGAALVGNYDAKEKSGQRGGTLMVFLEDDTLKWTFHHKIAGITLFGTFPDLVLDIDCVEQAMAEGRFDRKNSRRS
jgi:hypothetical protein